MICFRCLQKYVVYTLCNIHALKYERYENKVACRNVLLLDGGWTTRSPADGNKSRSLPKSICSQEVVSSCLGKDLSAWRRSPISGTDYSGQDHITVKDCFWIARLVMKHSLSVSELQTVCSVHVAKDLLLNGGWTSKSLADGNKFLSLPKCICSQENASSCRQGPERKAKEPNLRY